MKMRSIGVLAGLALFAAGCSTIPQSAVPAEAFTRNLLAKCRKPIGSGFGHLH